MARRSSPSRGSSSFGRGRSASPSRRATTQAPTSTRAVAPQPPPATQVGAPATTMAAPGGGMMANIASTAAGVAIGHTVGHAITGALGMNGGGHQPVETNAGVNEPQPMMQAQQGYQQQQQSTAGQDPCKLELDQFLSCAQSNDLQFCDGLNQMLKECKARYSNNAYMYQ